MCHLGGIGIAMQSDTVALECEWGTGAPIQVAEVHCNTPIHGALAESIAIQMDEFFTLYCNMATSTVGRIVVVEEEWVFKKVVEMLVVLDGGGGRTSLGRDGFCWLKEGMGLVW